MGQITDAIAGETATISNGKISPNAIKNEFNFDRFYHTTATLESSGGKDKGMNRPGKAAMGIVQIQPDTLTDINKWSGKNYTMKQIANDPVASKEAMKIWVDHYLEVNPSVSEVELAGAWRSGWAGRSNEAALIRRQRYLEEAQPKVKGK